MATAHHTPSLPNLPAPQGLGTRAVVVGGSPLGVDTMAYLTFTEVEAASALVNARGLGRVN